MASYNCNDSANSAYGAGSFGTCSGQATQSVNAPDTGLFQQVVSGGSFTIIAPLVVAVVVVVIASAIIGLRKRASK